MARDEWKGPGPLCGAVPMGRVYRIVVKGLSARPWRHRRPLTPLSGMPSSTPEKK
jgi:hypothetical protein